MILHLSNDLMLVGKVSSWAKANNIEYKKVSHAALSSEPDKYAGNRIVLCDLQLPGLDIAAIATAIKRDLPTVHLVGYAQHVMTELLENARQSEFDQVLTRGQFDQQFAEIITAVQSSDCDN